MNITSVKIKNISSGASNSNVEGVEHHKVLPYLIVTQPLHGSYDFTLPRKGTENASDGECFIVPAEVEQHIVHHNGDGGYLESHWVCMNVILNDVFSLSDIYRLPAKLPRDCAQKVERLIKTISYHESVYMRYSAAYELVDLIVSYAEPKEKNYDDMTKSLRRYIDENYSGKITKEDLARVIHSSVPTLYRVFQQNFHMTPSAYVNMVRLRHAAILLEFTDTAITEIALSIGFDNPIYFSRLFKQIYQQSPSAYRERCNEYNNNIN